MDALSFALGALCFWFVGLSTSLIDLVEGKIESRRLVNKILKKSLEGG